jgi:threonine/homoserine/homoserine lactone efflux protein
VAPGAFTGYRRLVLLPSLTTGFGLGLLVAAQVGPIWLLCARTALRTGLPGGLAVGLGAAVVDTAYACLGVAGMARILELPGLRTGLGLAGAAVLLLLGVRTLWAARRGPAAGEEAPGLPPLRALRTSLLATASNPLTIVTWAAIFAAAVAAGVARSLPQVVTLLAGVGIGSMTWFALLSGGMAVLGRRLGAPALRLADLVAGTGLVAFALLLGLRTFQPS